MKKAYEKPVISLESFQLSSNIAGECSETMSADQAEELKLIGGFADDCLPPNGFHVGCYHVPTDSATLMS